MSHRLGSVNHEYVDNNSVQLFDKTNVQLYHLQRKTVKNQSWSKWTGEWQLFQKAYWHVPAVFCLQCQS